MDEQITIWQTEAEIITLLGQRIREKRLSMNLTQEKLALETGLSKETIQKIENGHGPKLESFIRILRFFGELDRLDQILKPQNISPQELYQKRLEKGRQRSRKND